MLDLLKKIGLPATLAAVIASLVVMLPLAFTVDERYAKRADMKEVVEKLEKQNETLKQELAQTVAFQQIMVALIQAGKIPKVPTSGEVASQEEMIRIGWFRDLFRRKEEPVPVAATAPAPPPPAQPASAASAPTQPASAPVKIEKPVNWKELSEGLYRQQQRLIK